MAKQIWNNSINKHTDWGGDSSTNNYPVSGEKVLEFIKNSLDSKIGELYYDTLNNRYLVFSDSENRDIYLNDPVSNSKLLLGTFDAPFNYSAKIILNTPTYNTITLGSNGNVINFNVDILNKEGLSTGENILCTYTFRRGSVAESISELYNSGKNVLFNIDQFLGEGVNNITISIQGTTSLAATTVAVVYQVVDLKISTDVDISLIYDLRTGDKIMTVPFSISGYGTKVVEWYIDGVLQEFVKTEDEVVEAEVVRTKYITISNLSLGTHNLQIRTYVIIDGERFYSNTLYREFMVYTGVNKNTMFAIAAEVPSQYGIISERKLYSLVLYIPYELVFSTYTPTVKAECDVLIHLNNIELGSVHSENGVVNKITIVSTTSGSGTLSLSADDQVCEILTEIAETTMSIEEITDQLALAFRAVGKTNNATDKDQWSYGSYEGTFSGFNWNDTSGWVDNALYINKGASFGINYAPLANNPTQLGKTIELEFCTTNVNDDNAIICDLRNDNGTGIVITATSVKMISEGGMTIETSYRANEYVRFGFVINKSANTANKCMSFIYDKGIVSRGVAWLPTDKYTSDKTILFSGSEKAEVKLKNIRIYDAALTNDQMLNNYMLYRDSVIEMNAIYERNNVYEEGTTSFNYEKMIGRLPVMIITGDIPSLEATTDKDKQIVVDIDYYNIQDPELSFSMTNAALRPQGTSSMGYPKKNFRPYTQKIDATKVYDYKGNEIKDKLYAFKKGAQRVNCWCLKADYAESSGTHNTGIARLWNDILFNATINGEYVFRTEAQKKALENNYEYDVRTTIDGFPILLFYRMTKTSPLTFIGKYNFNNDKSTESVFGFKNIPNFNNSRMQCWEVLNNGNPLALFTSVDGFDSNWSEAFESRYPDTKTPNTSDLKAFCTWMTNVSASEFVTQKWEHLDIYKVAAYYVYLMRFGAVDQTVKNSMFTSEDGVKFYFINYDNDTINGLINTGRLLTPWYATRETLGEDGQPYYAGNESRLWNLLEQDSEFMSIVRSVDEALYSAGLTYENVINTFDNEQADKWVERVYNQDAQYKYISPYADSGIDNLFMLQGKRTTHRKYWLAKRFSLFDSKFITGDYKAQSIELKCINNTPSGQRFTITAGTNMDYGYGINNVAREGNIALVENQNNTFITQEVVNLGDPIRIYSAPNIKGLDLSQMSDVLAVVTIDKVYNKDLDTKLKTLIVGSATKENVGLEAISGLAMAKGLEYIDVQNMKGMKALDLSQQNNIKYVDTRGSNISAIEFAKGTPLETLHLSNAMQVINLQQMPKLNTLTTNDNFANVKTMLISQCPYLSSDYNFVLDWVNNKSNVQNLTLEMDGIAWNGISYDELIQIGMIGTKKLKGRVDLSEDNLSKEQIEELVLLFGANCLSPLNDFFIKVQDGVFIVGGVDSIIEGDSLQFLAEVVSDSEGVLTWSIINGGTANQSIDINGLLTTRDVNQDRTITIEAKFVPIQGDPIIGLKDITIIKAVHPTSVTIEGADILSTDTIYALNVEPTSGINRDYSIEWALENNENEHVGIKSNTGTTCTLTLKSSTPVGKVTLKAVITCSNGTKIVAIKEIKLDVKLTITISSNQDSDKEIKDNAQAIIKFGNETIVAKNKDIISVPINKNIVVSFSEIEGYKAPDTQIFTTGTGDISINGLYQTEIVYIILTAEDGSDLKDVVITINNKDYNYDTMLKIKIPFDIVYNIEFGEFNNLMKPQTITYTASQKERYVEAEYIIKPNIIKTTYDVIDTTRNTTLLYGNYAVHKALVKMIVDGIEVTPSYYFKFETTGIHSVDFYFSAINPPQNNYRYMFNNAIRLKTVDFFEFDGSQITSMGGMFNSCQALSYINFRNLNTSNVIDMMNLFYGCSSLTSLDLSGFDTSNVKDMRGMFYGCSTLTSLDLSNFDTSNVMSFSERDYGMFSNCSSLTSLDLSSFNTSKATNMRDMFSNCSSLTSLDLSSFDTSNVTDMNYVFSNCTSLTSLDLSSFDTSKVTNMICMFSNCSSLTSLDLSSFDTSKVTGMSSTFENCIRLGNIKIGDKIANTSANNYTFGNNSSSYTGYNTRGQNKLYVPVGATGYDTGAWLDPLQNTVKCGFTIVYSL